MKKLLATIALMTIGFNVQAATKKQLKNKIKVLKKEVKVLKKENEELKGTLFTKNIVISGLEQTIELKNEEIEALKELADTTEEVNPETSSQQSFIALSDLLEQQQEILATDKEIGGNTTADQAYFKGNVIQAAVHLNNVLITSSQLGSFPNGGFLGGSALTVEVGELIQTLNVTVEKNNLVLAVIKSNGELKVTKIELDSPNLHKTVLLTKDLENVQNLELHKFIYSGGTNKIRLIMKNLDGSDATTEELYL